VSIAMIPETHWQIRIVLTKLGWAWDGRLFISLLAFILNPALVLVIGSYGLGE
jgi:hypothetical protein